MKYLVVSDIHGNPDYVDYLFHLMEHENPDKVILLGDIMSISPDGLNIVNFINEYKDKIIITVGNMDRIDLLPNDIQDKIYEYYRERINDKEFIFTHGHLPKPNIDSIDVFVQGHTHMNGLMLLTDIGEKPLIFYNPGSIALPRGKTDNSYGIITDNELIIRDLDNKDVKKLSYRK